MNRRHRNAETGGNKKQYLYHNRKQGWDLITSEFKCRMEVQGILEVGFCIGILWVRVSNTTPAPGKTTTGMGAGIHHTVTYAVFRYHCSACKPTGWWLYFMQYSLALKR